VQDHISNRTGEGIADNAHGHLTTIEKRKNIFVGKLFLEQRN